MKKNNAIILLSGGQDSTTCLAWAKEKFNKIYGITFNYGQRHKIELNAAKKIAKITNTPLKTQKIEFFKDLTNNSLTNSNIEIEWEENKAQPNTFVEGRNHIFISIAAIYAKSLNISNIITGVCETDYSGYPDCREKFIKSLEKTLSLAMDYKFKIHTPLMNLSKKETVELMQNLGQISLLKHTKTCYKGNKEACGECPACELRLKGFKEAKIKDPIKYQNDK